MEGGKGGRGEGGKGGRREGWKGGRREEWKGGRGKEGRAGRSHVNIVLENRVYRTTEPPQPKALVLYPL